MKETENPLSHDYVLQDEGQLNMLDFKDNDSHSCHTVAGEEIVKDKEFLKEGETFVHV